jgi:hypothetical protein
VAICLGKVAHYLHGLSRQTQAVSEVLGRIEKENLHGSEECDVLHVDVANVFIATGILANASQCDSAPTVEDTIFHKNIA